jgi:3-oxoacyl-[acyl-carrier protein] reductase
MTAHPDSSQRPLDGKVALVTGASGGGVGTETARLLAIRGAAVIVNYVRNHAAAEHAVAEITAAGGQAKAIQADVGDSDQVERMTADTVAAYGRLDILVSSATTGERFRMAPFADLSWGEFSEGMNSRLRAAFTVTRAAVPIMRQQGGGRLIYVSSDHADGPAAPGMIINGTSAAALITFARYLACELGPSGITANVVCPGMIDTAGTARAARAALPPRFREIVASATPLGRIATPADVAQTIAFYASDDSAFSTGTVAHVNGGLGLARLTASFSTERASSPGHQA